ncbi:inositol monophosphatase family protein [Desulfospira joergensenii]|uniref:inositol monophosphatase family protein n=1 Tax=Desulfospira joergensenii TaxID=53329 RepID=UPI0003B47F97|nr:inositol monophosphatase family protein [Desulfospira joergensenii]
MDSFLKDLLREAGRICIQEQGRLNRNDIEFKSQKDIVTVTDKKVEDLIIKRIRHRHPSHDILGEETGRSPASVSKNSEKYLWIIDPIDGTTSFFHGQPFYSISIALNRGDETLLGGVYAPVLDQMFFAKKDGGAFLNDESIRVSSCECLVESVMATGFACLRAGLKKNNLVYFNRIVPLLRDIRRFGSAALDLCYVACGKIDGFWEMELNLYDIAAGALIAREAGAVVSDFSGGNHFPDQGIVAANPFLSGLLIDQLNSRH